MEAARVSLQRASNELIPDFIAFDTKIGLKVIFEKEQFRFVVFLYLSKNVSVYQPSIEYKIYFL